MSVSLSSLPGKVGKPDSTQRDPTLWDGIFRLTVKNNSEATSLNLEGFITYRNILSWRLGHVTCAIAQNPTLRGLRARLQVP